MRPAARLDVPLKSMCSSTWERPPPSHLPSSMLPALHHCCAEMTGALWSSRIISGKPLGRVMRCTPGGMGGMPGSVLTLDFVVILTRGQVAATSNLRRFGFPRRRGTFVRGQKGAAKGLEEFIAALKVLPAVVRGLCQQIALHHVEDNLAEILAPAHPPLVKDHLGHGAELLQGVAPNACQQLLPGHVADLVLGFLVHYFLGEIEGLADKQVSVPMVEPIGQDQFIEGIFRVDVLHNFTARVRRRAGRAGVLCAMPSPPSRSGTKG